MTSPRPTRPPGIPKREGQEEITDEKIIEWLGESDYLLYTKITSPYQQPYDSQRIRELITQVWAMGLGLAALKKAVQKQDWDSLYRFVRAWSPSSEWLKAQEEYVMNLSKSEKMLLQVRLLVNNQA